MTDKPMTVEDDKFTVIKGGQIKGEFSTFEEARDFAYDILHFMGNGGKVEIRDDLDWLERHVIPVPGVPIS